MAKTTSSSNSRRNSPPPEPAADQIRPAGLEDVLVDAMMPYAEHVILERALPRVEDGLKPVQRRILFTMSELGTTPDKPHRKSVRIVGDCLGKFHPHGDSSVYDAMVRMAQPYSMRAPLVDGHGNFGSIDNDSAAAMRYTEARMTPLAMEMLRDLDKDTVPQRLNFDDTLKEPEVLPSRYPNLLVNGSSGIAVGLATNIPPHNLDESIKAVVTRIDKPTCSLDDILRVMPGPDFPTGGQLLKTPELRAAYETGRGKLPLRARAHIEDAAAGRKQIVITEMPYQIAKAGLLERILKTSEEKRALFAGIHDIRDESDRDGLRAVIELKREVDPNRMLALLYKYTDMQITFGVNIFVIADGKPRQMGLLSIIDEYVNHQKRVITRRTRYDLEKAQARAHILEGLIRAVDVLDEIIALIRRSKDAREAKARLIERFRFTDVQSQAILDLRLQRLTGLEILALKNERDALLKQIEKFERILADERLLLRVIKDELQDIAKRFGNPRRTEIIAPPDESTVIESAEQTAPEPIRVTLTRGGLLRKQFGHADRKQDKSIDKAAELPCARLDTMDDAVLLLFTDQGNAYRLLSSSVPEVRTARDKGGALPALLAGFGDKESIIRVLAVRPGEWSKSPELIFVTRAGLVRRCAANEFDVNRQRFAAMKLHDGDSLIDVLTFVEGQHLMTVTEQGMAVVIDPAAIEPATRASGGVKGMRLDASDRVLAAITLTPGEGELIIATDTGCGKRVLIADFDPQNRGGKGVRCVTWAKNGASGTRLAGALRVTTPYDVCFIYKDGSVHRFSSEEFRLAGRADKPHVIDLVAGNNPVAAITVGE
ncbi:MAG: DNA topoisomerase 4 subunit A [Oscillospiraceae bacterium]|jgi:DNA gyrase subunit A|nr:DNA topoisomerase 4 subunit A [Oscillospiraceae bacterium]